MRVSGFQLGAFRAFNNAFLPISPLTVVVGENSSGKSSLAQALLILKQSLGGQAPGAQVPTLVLNGREVEGGSYRDIVHGGSEQQTMEFKFHFSPDSAVSPPRPIAPVFDDPTLEEEVYFSQEWKPPRSLLGLPMKVNAKFENEEPFGPRLVELSVEIEDYGGVRVLRTEGVERSRHWRVYVTGLKRGVFRAAFSTGRLFPWIYPRSGWREGRTMRAATQSKEFLFASMCGLLDEVIWRFLSRIRFLGPFRTPPKRRYFFSGFGARETGSAGEQAVDLLITEQLLRRTGAGSLNALVGRWLSRLRLAHSMHPVLLAKSASLFEVRIRESKRAPEINMADVGFGISQVLPVLIQGLLTPRGGTFIVQQPELHLHPDAQAGLADFFLYLAREGVFCVVETHSEYLLARLRRRLAEAKNLKTRERGGMARDAVSIVLTEQTRRGHAARMIRLDENFQFINMPRGFMEQALEDRMAIVKAIAR